MPPLLPPPSLGRCSAPSRSFLRGPDGPAGAPPGQDLRSGALIGPRANPAQTQDPYYKVSTVPGEPRLYAPEAHYFRQIRAFRLRQPAWAPGRSVAPRAVCLQRGTHFGQGAPGGEG